MQHLTLVSLRFETMPGCRPGACTGTGSCPPPPDDHRIFYRQSDLFGICDIYPGCRQAACTGIGSCLPPPAQRERNGTQYAVVHRNVCLAWRPAACTGTSSCPHPPVTADTRIHLHIVGQPRLFLRQMSALSALRVLGTSAQPEPGHSTGKP